MKESQVEGRKKSPTAHVETAEHSRLNEARETGVLQRTGAV